MIENFKYVSKNVLCKNIMVWIERKCPLPEHTPALLKYMWEDQDLALSEHKEPTRSAGGWVVTALTVLTA